MVLELSHDKALIVVVRKGTVVEAIVRLFVAQGEGVWEGGQLCGDVRPNTLCVTSSPEQSSLSRLQELWKRSERDELVQDNRHKHHRISVICGKLMLNLSTILFELPVKIYIFIV